MLAAIGLGDYLGLDQSEATFPIPSPPEVRGRFRNDEFDDGPYGGLQHVTTESSGVSARDDHVRVQAGQAFLVEGDIAEQTDDLDLLVEGYLLIFLFLPVEIPEYDPAQSAEPGERSRCDIPFSNERFEATDELFPCIEDNREGALGAIVDEA